VKQYWRAVRDERSYSWEELTAEPRGVDYIETNAAGLPAMWLLPKGHAEDRVLLCIHGGGFVSGSMYSHRKMFGHLAKASGVRALVFDYHFAPEYTHPSQVDETAAVHQWLLERFQHIAFAGDSCGGLLAIAAQLRARDEGLRLPAAAVLFSPWIDLDATGASYMANKETDAFFTADVVRDLGRTYLGAEGELGPLSVLSPVYIQVGGDEVLLDDARRLAALARRDGVEAELEVVPGMQHTFQMAAGRLPEADAAIARAAAWVRDKLREPR
jgi:acetyl esterase/lipase